MRSLRLIFIVVALALLPGDAAAAGWSVLAIDDFNPGGNAVTPIDTATNTAGAAIPTGPTPFRAAVTPEGPRAIVANSHNGAPRPPGVTTIDFPPGQAPVARDEVRFGSGELALIAMSPDGARAYLTAGTTTV